MVVVAALSFGSAVPMNDLGLLFPGCSFPWLDEKVLIFRTCVRAVDGDWVLAADRTVVRTTCG